MKQGLNFLLPVKFGVDLSTVSSIEFQFKQTKEYVSEPLKESIYSSDGDGDATIGQLEDGTEVILVPWTQDDTYKFKPGKEFFMDTRITLQDSDYNPSTPIVRLIMEPTLFQYD